MQYKTSDYRANNISRYEKCPVNQHITSFRGIGHTYYIIKPSNPKSIAFLLYLQFDFIRGLEYTIVNECNCKVIYGEIMMEYLSIKQTSEKWGITVRRI